MRQGYKTTSKALNVLRNAMGLIYCAIRRSQEPSEEGLGQGGDKEPDGQSNRASEEPPSQRWKNLPEQQSQKYSNQAFMVEWLG